MNFLINLFLSLSLSFLSLFNLGGEKYNPNKILNKIYFEEESTDDIYVPPYVSTGGVKDANDDGYEYNETYDASINLSPEEYNLMDSYHTQLDANINSFENDYDYDYFYFKILEDSYVTLNFSLVNANCYSYIALERLCYSDVNEDGAYHFPQIVEDDISNLQYKSFDNLILSPGTYYIFIRNDYINDIYAFFEYTLELFVEKIEYEPETIRIGDLKYNKNCGGALWLSDFFPTYNQQLLATSGEVEYYNHKGQSLNYSDYALNDLNEILNGEETLLAAYYIWDPAIIHVIHCVSLSIRESLSAYREAANNEKIQLTITKNLIEDGISLIINVVGAAVSSFVVNLILGVVEDSLLQQIDLIFEMLMPEISYEFTLYSDFFAALVTQTTIEGIHNNTGDDYNINIDNLPKELDYCLYLPYYFSLSTGENSIDGYPKYLINVKNVHETFRDSSILTTNDKYIYSLRDDALINGKIYGINDSDDLSDIFNLTRASEINDIDPTINELVLNNSESIIKVNDGQSVWYKFQTKDITETTRYYFSCNNQGGTDSEKTENFYIDLFSYPTKGYSYDNIIATKNGGYIHKDLYIGENNYVGGCYFSILLDPNQTLYLRIRGDNFEELLTKNLRVELTENSSIIHSHEYDIYSYKNNVAHLVECRCGEYLTEPHVVKSGTNICLLCKGYANTGFVGFMSENYHFVSINGSYILNSGVIVLVEADIDLYFKKQLKFYNKNLEVM